MARLNKEDGINTLGFALLKNHQHPSSSIAITNVDKDDLQDGTDLSINTEEQLLLKSLRGLASNL